MMFQERNILSRWSNRASFRVSFLRTATLLGASLLARQTLAAASADAAAPLFTPSVSLENYSLVVVGVGIIGIAQGVLVFMNLRDKFKPHPPYEEKFAARDHTHPELIADAECRLRHDAFISEQRHSIKHATLDREALQRQLDGIRGELKENDRKGEERASLTHERINGLSGPLNSLLGRFNDHLNQSQGVR